MDEHSNFFTCRSEKRESDDIILSCILFFSHDEHTIQSAVLSGKVSVDVVVVDVVVVNVDVVVVVVDYVVVVVAVDHVVVVVVVVNVEYGVKLSPCHFHPCNWAETYMMIKPDHDQFARIFWLVFLVSISLIMQKLGIIMLVCFWLAQYKWFAYVNCSYFPNFLVSVYQPVHHSLIFNWTAKLTFFNTIG